MTDEHRAPSRVGALSARWRALPRAAKWGAYAGVLIGAYFLVVEPALDWRNALDAASDRAELLLRQYDTQEQSRSEAMSRSALGSAAFGTVAVPEKDPALVQLVSDRIAGVLGDRGVTEWNVQTQRGAPMGKAVLPSLVKPEGEELQRVVFNVTLTDRTSTVLGVIADLERVPEIAAIGQVQLRRVEKGKDRIQATLTPEVWVIAPREGAR